MPGYENAARISASGYAVFGDALPHTFETTTGYMHNRTEWPGTVYDFSGCPLAITQSGSTVSRATGALITPRHLLVAHHYTIPSGTVYFVAPSGTVVERTITANSGLIGLDILILTLDSAATDCKVYPLPTAESQDALLDNTIWVLHRDRTLFTRYVSNQATVATNHREDSTDEDPISGDSSQPAFITRGSELVLLGTNFTTTYFDKISLHLENIQDYCDATSQTIQTVSVDPASWVQPLAAAI